MGLRKKDDPTKVVGEGRAATVTTSPKPPPPKAPMETCARDPRRRSQTLLGGKNEKASPNGTIHKGKADGGNRNEIPKERIPKGRILKEGTKAKIPKGKDSKRGGSKVGAPKQGRV